MPAVFPGKALERAGWALGFLTSYVVLDWISFIRPLQHLNLTPWNPAPALGLLLLIRYGRRGGPLLFAAIFGSDYLVRDLPGGVAVAIGLAGLLTAGYGAIAWCLRRFMPDGGMFSGRRSLVLWSLIILAGTLANSLLYVYFLGLIGLLEVHEWTSALIRFWVGDGVGIFVALPFLWWLQDSPRRTIIRAAVLRDETAAYLALGVVTLWIAFVPGAAANFRYFHVLYLPIVWAASRQGLPGAVVCVSFMQLGMIVAGMSHEAGQITLLELQMRALILAFVGFLIGVVVDEQRRSTAELRQTVRLAVAGEMAGALAHELNQPLTALNAYCSAGARLLERGASQEQLRDVVGRIAGEAQRAADVLRRLRDFFRTGATNLEMVWLGAVVDAATEPFRQKAHAIGLDFSVAVAPACIVLVDRLHIELVLRNLLANGFEAAAGGQRPPQVAVRTTLEPGGRVQIVVEDSGPGVAPSVADELFEPLTSTKSDGLGLGLAISRAIAEAHGGSLTVDTGGCGRFRLTLPIESGGIAIHG